MAARATSGGKAQRTAARAELAHLLAAAYLRLLASRAHNSREQAHLRSRNSSELTGYELAPE